MKARAKHTVKLIFLSMFVACFIILNSGCGLEFDHINDVHPPVVNFTRVHTETDPIPYENRILQVETNTENKNKDESSLIFEGIDIYYKLYSNYSSCVSEYSALNTMAKTASTTLNSASSMINTYKFQKLQNSNKSEAVLFPHENGKHYYEIRLTKYGSLSNNDFHYNDGDTEPYQYVPYIKEDGKWTGIPMRYFGNRRFDFYRDSSTFNAPLPKTTNYEEDVGATSSDNQYWYVTFYAVVVAHDEYFTTYYSTIEHVGTLCIDAKSNLN